MQTMQKNAHYIYIYIYTHDLRDLEWQTGCQYSFRLPIENGVHSKCKSVLDRLGRFSTLVTILGLSHKVMDRRSAM